MRRDLYAALLNPADHMLITGLLAAREAMTKTEKTEAAKRRAVSAELRDLERKAREARHA